MKVYLDTIGCRLNQSEIEKLANQFRAAGHEIVESAIHAELVVVNTCAVTTEAASDSRQKIRQASRAGVSEIIVTGCWATLEPEKAGQLPGVSRVVKNPEKEHIVEDRLQISPEAFDLEPLERHPLPGIHQRTRAFIKVQDGCDNYCTFCITRITRGKGHSQDIESILADIHFAQAGGVKEVVLSGVHTGSWGTDFPEKKHLKDLIGRILVETDMPRVRLSSLEPWDLEPDFFDLWHNPRLCRHLHLPLQSGSARTLKHMARKTTPESFAELVRLARRICPEMAITTDIIVGFPGETEEDFEESLAFVKQMEFAAGHVFNFSQRPGTPAANYPDQVHPKIRKERSTQMRAAVRESGEQFRGQFLEKTVSVLWESALGLGPDGWQMEGLTDQYLRVRAFSPGNVWNQIQKVHLIELLEDGFLGFVEREK
jgi:threonylcarbamoyladenosine tRNA methylthiotransferase MtaB